MHVATLMSMVGGRTIIVTTSDTVAMADPCKRGIVGDTGGIFALSGCRPMKVVFYNGTGFVDAPVRIVMGLCEGRLESEYFTAVSRCLSSFLKFVGGGRCFYSARVRGTGVRGRVRGFCALVLGVTTGATGRGGDLFLGRFVLRLGDVIIGSYRGYASFRGFPRGSFIRSVGMRYMGMVTGRGSIFKSGTPLGQLFIRTFTGFMIRKGDGFTGRARVMIMKCKSGRVFPSLHSIYLC